MQNLIENMQCGKIKEKCANALQVKKMKTAKAHREQYAV